MTKKIREVAVRYDLESPFKQYPCLWFLIDNKYLFRYSTYTEMLDAVDYMSFSYNTTVNDRANAGVHIVDHRLHKIFYDYEVEL